MRATLILSLTFLLTCCLVAGCDDDTSSDSDTGLDLQEVPSDTALSDIAAQDAADSTGEDGSADLLADADAEDSPTPTASCAELLAPGVTIEIDPEGPNVQIHASVAFDGEGVWVAYNLVDQPGSSGFDAYAVRLACDGSVNVPRFALHPPTTINEIDPSIAVHDGVLYAAWQGDNQSGVDNMDVYYRTFRTDGTAIMDAALTLETTLGGAPVTGNVWMPDVAAIPSGGFVIAAARANAEHNAFLAFAQRVADDGALIGDAVEGGIDATAYDKNVAAIVGNNGHIYMSWARSFDAADERPVFADILDGHGIGRFLQVGQRLLLPFPILDPGALHGKLVNVSVCQFRDRLLKLRRGRKRHVEILFQDLFQYQERRHVP